MADPAIIKNFRDIRFALQHLNNEIENLKPGDAKIINDTLVSWTSRMSPEWRKGNKNEIVAMANKLIGHEYSRTDFNPDEIGVYRFTESDSFWSKIKDSMVQVNVLFEIGRPGHMGASYFVICRVGEDKYFLVYSIYI